MERLETRELVYFVAVAEELHFGRAAQRLDLAQPPLSRAVARLERRLGVQLLERTSRRVLLTAAGHVFLAESRKALDAIDTAARRTQQAAATPRLTLAVKPGVGSGLLPSLLETYDRGGTTASVDVVFTHDQPAALRNGTADAAVVCGGEDLSGLHTVDLAEERPVVLLPAGHELAARREVTLAEVGRVESYRPACPPLGLDQIVELVALGRLVVVVGESAGTRLGPAVTAVSVADLPGTLLVLAWSRPAPTPQLGALISAATRLAPRHLRRPKVS
jgi:DNA-binding transcriptional LysR family regulator